jgi:phosphatidylinositol 4-phosphatase
LKSLADEEEDESDDEGTITDAETTDAEGTMGSMSRESIAPEADEDPIQPVDRSKRFSWNKFLPVRKQPKAAAPTEGEIQEDPTKETSPRASTYPPVDPSAKPFPSDPPQRRDLETKIIRQLTREFASGGFFYTTTFDLTHTLQNKRRKLVSRQNTDTALHTLLKNPSTSSVSLAEDASENVTDDFVEPDIHLPLWRRADRRFFWNEWLLKDFIDLGLHAFICPVMQGWVQSSKLNVDGIPVDFVVISRRSKDRAGLRYQRRGIDDEGHVANMVETEMIVRAKVSIEHHGADG